MIHPAPRCGSSFARLRIGLLGGSFNPAHEGHLAISLHALRRLKLDQVWWLVSPCNPLKSPRDLLPLPVRMARAKAQTHGHPRLLVTGLEAALGTVYTVDTLTALRQRFPGARFVWLMGADNLLGFDRWKRWQRLFTLMPIAVFRRPGYPAERWRGKAARHFAWARRGAAGAAGLADSAAPAWMVLDNRLNPASSTALRALWGGNANASSGQKGN